MAISVDWPSGVISVPKADMALVNASPETRELDLDTFRKTLRQLEETTPGRPFPITHAYEPPDLLAGTTLSFKLRLNTEYYSVTFEDGQYRVNIVGGNSNVGDAVNENQVSVRTNNSAGLVNVGSSLTAGQEAQLQLILDLLEADETLTPTQITKYHRATKAQLLQKDVTGGTINGTITIDE